MCVASIAAGIAVILFAAPALADPHDDLARVERDIARTKAALEASSAKVEAAAAALEEANQRLPAVQQRLAEAQGLLAAAQARATSAHRAVLRADADLTIADRALSRAVTKVEQTRSAIGEYAASAYRGRDVAGIDALFSLTNPADFVAGLTYMERIGQEEQRTLTANTQARAAAKNQQNVQAGRKRTAQAAREEAQDSLRAALQAEQDAAQAEADVAAVVAEREGALKVARDERAATEQRYKDLQAESERIAAEIRALAKAGGPVLRPGERLIMPVVGWKSSDFGMRLDPFYGVYRLHAGTDFAAPGGTPIWAALGGKVFRAGWNGGYGNYTCIYHGVYQGKGFATCYAHQSAILVKVNQQVSQGQVIGRVGTTGASTGTHLHFEVRLDGEPVNPLPYLPACLC
jgi:murein DD-endopeptidase MepM/ murein hydrolase activator NlpD